MSDQPVDVNIQRDVLVAWLEIIRSDSVMQ